MVIDEAAAIPLPLVRKLLGNHIVFMSSTVSGYEGTGRSLSLKLIDDLRKNRSKSKSLYEISLSESIRYSQNDPIEKWLSDLLCLEACSSDKNSSINYAPVPDKCEMFYVNRDTLFSYHSASEKFLQKLMALFVSSHYKNSPNDLQILSDAPAHHIFVLTPPIGQNQTSVPDILAVVQVAMEGRISKKAVAESLAKRDRPNGDMIPWLMQQQFQDDNLPELSGARVVRIAVNENYQSQGYGSQALKLLHEYYLGNYSDYSVENDPDKDEIVNNSEGLENEVVTPRKHLPPLFVPLTERKVEKLDWIGTSFGMTDNLARFWTRNGYKPLYISQVKNQVTGEYSSVMMKAIQKSDDWVTKFYLDFRRRFVSLLSYEFRSFSLPLSCMLLSMSSSEQKLSEKEENEYLEKFFLGFDLKRLEAYTGNFVDYPMIMDLLPKIAELYYTGKIKKSRVQLSHKLQQAILVGIGLQRKSLDDIAREFDIEASQVKGLFMRMIRVFTKGFREIQGAKVAPAIENEVSSFEQKQDEIDEERKKRKRTVEEKKVIDDLEKDFAIKGDDKEWAESSTINSSYVNIKSTVPTKKKKVETKSPKQTKKKKKTRTLD